MEVQNPAHENGTYQDDTGTKEQCVSAMLQREMTTKYSFTLCDLGKEHVITKLRASGFIVKLKVYFHIVRDSYISLLCTKIVPTKYTQVY